MVEVQKRSQRCQRQSAKKRVLIVDDDTNVLDGYRRLLRHQGDVWDMTFCDSASGALEQLRKVPFDVLVTDLQMPAMNGVELMTQVIEVAPAVARIVLTGYASMTSSVAVSDLAHQILNKPCDLETLRDAIDYGCQIQSMITCERVKQAVGRVGRLPSPPIIYHELNRALAEDTTDAAVITRIIEQDMMISAKLLQLVNSAFFGLKLQVACLEQAVTLLGVRQIRDIVLATHLFEAFPKARGGDGLNLECLREHSVAVAKLARSIVLEEGGGRELADQAFVGGLLHCFGMLVLASNGFAKYNKAVDYCRRKNRTLIEVEKVLFGATHAEAGAYLLGLWRIPPVIVEAVLMHQQPRRLSSGGWSPLAAVHVADALLHECADNSAPYPGTAMDRGYIDALGLTPRLDAWRVLADAQMAGTDRGDS